MAKTVSAGFVELLNKRLRLTPDQSAMAASRAATLKDFLDTTFSMHERAFTIGSYRRGTLIRPERDIDLLAPLSYGAYKERYDQKSRDFLYFVRDKLNAGYARTKVSSREVAVLLDFTVIRTDVVPAFKRDGGGFFIPSGRNGWTATNPQYHSRIINERDGALGNRLKPVVRLMKFWNVQNGGHLRSFHIELMVWRMWEDATSIPLYANAAMQSISAMRGWVRSTFEDPWEGGGRVDGYLASDVRARVIRMLDQDAKTSVEAESFRKQGKVEKAFDRWNSVFNKGFPAYG